MVAETRTIQILDPRPEDIPEERSLSGQIPTLEGKVIGLLENRKYHADAFLQELQKVLEKDYGAKKVVYARKFTFSAPCADDTIDSLVEECDAVIHGIAD
ncbi:MAG: hypothetical protein O2909_09105 [Chloroflexi bacterium]|nr:hypothetical protein [Chloroflexota bacterium]MDA1219585.1 hypothetical protein [Chloroflexota bacterium]PKB57552.1 MAG: hypothetical protein BZY73_02650 [SAR202 cluster bacterium Casp-Chloro-G3]